MSHLVATPDVCSCPKGWIGFDCRVPVCEQGYYEPQLGSFVEGIKTDEDFATFEPFLDPRRPYDLDSSRSFSSNPDVPVWVERFLNETTIERKLIVVDGSQYLAANGSQVQGGYECSIRSVTQWEDYRSGFVFEHPNYYSRYMDKEMQHSPTHYKTDKLVKYDRDYLAQNERSFVYTDVGHFKDGVWRVTGNNWEKGICTIEFERRCDDDSGELSVVLVQDTDEVRLEIPNGADIISI